MSGFTPGPWWTEIDNVFAGEPSNSIYVADCAPMGSPDEGTPTGIANAHLIAAAPDLYEALDGYLHAVSRSATVLAAEKAKTALAKARGVQS